MPEDKELCKKMLSYAAFCDKCKDLSVNDVIIQLRTFFSDEILAISLSELRKNDNEKR